MGNPAPSKCIYNTTPTHNAEGSSQNGDWKNYKTQKTRKSNIYLSNAKYNLKDFNDLVVSKAFYNYICNS